MARAVVRVDRRRCYRRPDDRASVCACPVVRQGRRKGFRRGWLVPQRIGRRTHRRQAALPTSRTAMQEAVRAAVPATRLPLPGGPPRKRHKPPPSPAPPPPAPPPPDPPPAPLNGTGGLHSIQDFRCDPRLAGRRRARLRLVLGPHRPRLRPLSDDTRPARSRALEGFPESPFAFARMSRPVKGRSGLEHNAGRSRRDRPGHRNRVVATFRSGRPIPAGRIRSRAAPLRWDRLHAGAVWVVLHHEWESSASTRRRTRWLRRSHWVPGLAQGRQGLTAANGFVWSAGAGARGAWIPVERIDPATNAATPVLDGSDRLRRKGGSGTHSGSSSASRAGQVLPLCWSISTALGIGRRQRRARRLRRTQSPRVGAPCGR